MFFFKKPKPVLKDLIPSDYVDIHSHLLFGIDDGAKTFSDTLEFTKALMNIGFSEFITTPHTLTHVWDNTRDGILKKHEEAAKLLKDNNVDVPFAVASEYIIDNDFVNLFKTQKLLTLKENYVLVEMSYLNPPIQLYNILFELQVAGYKPILAHPERYVFFHDKFEEYHLLKKAGCKFQLNLLSSVGYYGPKVAMASEKLLSLGMIDFVGSDLHHGKHLAAFSNKIVLKETTPLKEALENNRYFSSAK